MNDTLWGHYMEILGYIASIFMGISLGLIGGGGSILTVPILVYLFSLSPVVATGYSLFIVGLTALFGGFGYIKQGLVDFKTGAIFAGPSFLGVYTARSFVVPHLPDPVFSLFQFSVSKNLFVMLVFAVLMIFASYSMIKGSKNVKPNSLSTLPPAKKYALIGLEGLIVGGVTGLVGAGGGFLIIPALVVLVGLPMKKAVGTSLFIIAIKSLLGFTGDLKAHASIDWTLLLTIASIAIVGIFVGSYLTRYIDEAKLKKGFGIFVLVMGTGILIQQVSAM